MKCFLDGRSFDGARVAAREIGTGGVSGPQLHNMSIVFEQDEFVAMLSTAYNGLVESMREDIALVGEADEDERACVEYADLAEIIARAPIALPGLMRDYLWGDLLQSCFGGNPIERCEYVVDAYKTMELRGAKVMVVGTAYRIRPFEGNGKDYQSGGAQ